MTRPGCGQLPPGRAQDAAAAGALEEDEPESDLLLEEPEEVEELDSALLEEESEPEDEEDSEVDPLLTVEEPERLSVR
jgi:hypothetical protein